MIKKIFDYGEGYIVETWCDGDRILQMYNNGNQLRLELRCIEEDYFEAVEKMMQIIETVIPTEYKE